METLARYYVTALECDSAVFAARHPHAFLLKHPADASAHASSHAGSLDLGDEESMQTILTRSISSDGALIESGAFGDEWRVVVVSNNLDGTLRDRVSIGRAHSCDIVLPFSSVSKVHAQFHFEGRRPTHLSDSGSANGTRVNGRRLARGEIAPVAIGDVLTFGSIELEFVDAAGFHTVLVGASGA